MRFLLTPEIDGIRIYPCSIEARVCHKLTSRDVRDEL